MRRSDMKAEYGVCSPPGEYCPHMDADIWKSAEAVSPGIVCQVHFNCFSSDPPPPKHTPFPNSPPPPLALFQGHSPLIGLLDEVEWFCFGALRSSGEELAKPKVIVTVEGTQGHGGPRRAYPGHRDLCGDR